MWDNIWFYKMRGMQNVNLPNKTSIEEYTMISISRIVLLQIFLVLLLSSFHKVKRGLFERKRVYVELFNDLGLNVTVHCKSGHSDLGSHFIQYPNGFYQFNFKPNAFGTSDYYCNF